MHEGKNNVEVLDKSFTIDEEISQLTKLRTEPTENMRKATYPRQKLPIPIVRMLSEREAMGGFSVADCSHALGRYLPVNGPWCIDRMDSQAYVSQFSNDGSLLVAGFQGSDIKVYDVENQWKVRKNITAKSLHWTITDTSLSPSKCFLAYASMSATVHIVDVGSATTESHANVTAFPKDAAYSNIPISNYMDLEKVCGEGHATGQWAKSANSQTPLATEEFNLEEDDTPIFVELDLNRVADSESPEVENNKRAKPSSSKSTAKSKKTKISEVDQSLREYIVIMADSVTQVANAIQNTSRVAEEKKMFTELIADLLNISGFCKEEINFIYDNLSKNPTMIQSFLAKPVDMKASWMRQELDKWVPLL